MTAINAFIKRDRAFLMTDASMYTPQRLVVGFGQKAVAMPTLKAAVAVRGPQRVGALLAMEMSITFASFDQILERGADYFPIILNLLRNDLPDPSEAVQIVAIGWSEENNRPAGLYFDTLSGAFDTIEEDFMAPLTDEAEDRNLASIGCDLSTNLDIGKFHPVRHGIPIMEAQRRMLLPYFDSDERLSLVGGNILLTEVTRDGVMQMVVHRWDDEIGENIQPEPFQPPALSRADRRRLEKRQRAHAA